MADVLRATRGVPGFHAAARVTLVEASPRLRGQQRAGAHQGVGLAARGKAAHAQHPVDSVAGFLHAPQARRLGAAHHRQYVPVEHGRQALVQAAHVALDAGVDHIAVQRLH